MITLLSNWMEWLTVSGYIAFAGFVFWQVMARSHPPKR